MPAAAAGVNAICIYRDSDVNLCVRTVQSLDAKVGKPRQDSPWIVGADAGTRQPKVCTLEDDAQPYHQKVKGPMSSEGQESEKAGD